MNILPKPPPEIVEAAYKVANWAEKNGPCDHWEIGPVCSRKWVDDALGRAQINPEWKALESSGKPYLEADSTGKINPFPANP